MVEGLLVLIHAFLQHLDVDFLILDHDKEGCQQWATDKLDVVEICLVLVGVLFVHELAHRQTEVLLDISLLVELFKHAIHPLVEHFSFIPDDFKDVTRPKHTRVNQHSVLELLK